VFCLGERQGFEARVGEVFDVDPDYTVNLTLASRCISRSKEIIPGAFVGGISPSRPALSTPHTIWLLALS
jgi:hypothetical protein